MLLDLLSGEVRLGRGRNRRMGGQYGLLRSSRLDPGFPRLEQSDSQHKCTLGAAHAFARNLDRKDSHLFSARFVIDYGGGVDLGR